MKRISLILLISVLAYHLAIAQAPYTVTYVTNFAPIQLTVLSPSSSVNKIKGTPYMNEEESFFPGRVIVDDSIELTDMKLRYNTYSQQMELKDGDEVKALIAKDRINKVLLGDKAFENRLYKNDDVFEKGYLEMIFVGKISIYKKHLCKIKAGYYNATVDAGSKNDKFIHEYDYYIMKPGYENPVKIFFSKRNFLNLFGDKKAQVKKYMKDNRLRFKRQNDLIRILAHYETL